MRRSRNLVAALAAFVALAAPAAAPAPVAAGVPARLSAFGSCGQLVGYARRQAFHELRAYSGRRVGAPMPMAGAPATSPTQGDGAAGGAGGTGHSQTNVQEAGVDEPDVVKLDDTRMFSVVDGTLRAIDLTGPRPRVTASLHLAGDDHQLLLRGDRLIVIGQDWDDYVVRMVEVDAGDPGALRVTRAITAPGYYVDARENGPTARIVLAAPEPDVYSADAIRKTRWLPRGLFYSRATGSRVKRPLTTCRAVRHPSKFGGLGMLTVLTFDLDVGLVPVDSDAIMTDGETVYGSPDALYVATEQWVAPDTPAGDIPTDSTTLVHRLTGGDAPVTTYAGSGSVPGYLLNQFSLSEHAGFLRVATTSEPSWAGDVAPTAQPQGESQSQVTVLEPRNGRLEEAGRVTGLGRGERIYAVRFIGDAGFVVTFRETDPLYSIDLRDPRHPRVAGELKIPGYSAYLHPVGDGLLLGVGQEVTSDGRLRGTQVSLFDVSDPSRPRRVAHRALGASSSSDVENDHRAFLYWPDTRLAVLPLSVEAAGDYAEDPAWAGAVGLRVGPGPRLAEVERFQQGSAAHPSPVIRAAVHGGRLLTVSRDGLRVSDLETLSPQAWVGF
ncbi:MAG: hypothetical protein QOE65_565 [Solirubrobacteraceae bacterium]|jgi:uncharacterized secreted protein with C-terminal beta-propeller domain|nr:hypothetical protein [Solirubrobacteraceae bacterium]